MSGVRDARARAFDPRRRIGVVILAMLALLPVGACNDDSGHEAESPNAASAAETSEPGTSPDADLEAALAAARDVEVPEEELRPAFERLETVHRLVGSPGFVETFHASARQASGATYALTMRTVHRAEPPSYRALAVIEREGDEAEQARQLLDMAPKGRMSLSLVPRAGGSLEQVRVGDRYWEREAGDQWLPATEQPEMRALGSRTPVLALSHAFGSPTVARDLPAPSSSELIVGLSTTHYRLEGILLFRALWEGADLPGAPRAPPGTPAREAGPGTVDVWATSDGVVLRAEFRLETEQGETYEGTFELLEIGEQPEIRPPD